MNSDTDARIAAEYAGGTDTQEIADRYGVTPAYVDRVVEDATMARPEPRSRFDLGVTGNRLLLAAAVGWVGWFAAGWAVGLVVAAFVYLLATLVSRSRP